MAAAAGDAGVQSWFVDSWEDRITNSEHKYNTLFVSNVATWGLLGARS